MAAPVHHNGHQHIYGHKLQAGDEKLLKIIRENLTELEAGLTNDELWRLEHLRMHEKHSGHDEMHAEMVFILISATIFSQIVLMMWKKHHLKSYQTVTMFGVWFIPFILSLSNRHWRFIFVWLLYSCITILITIKALQKPLQPTTPRLVYKWFLFIYKACCFIGIFAYFIMLISLMGLPLLWGGKTHTFIDFAILTIFYGIYYGILGRDMAEVCADKMASHIGYYKPVGMPTRTLDPGVCAVCGNRLLVPLEENGVIENTYKLSCGHVFHEFCIRGWCIVGKKEICPYCKEKVNLKRTFSNPWEKPHLLYGQLLDWVRLMLAWQPAIVFFVQKLNDYLGLK